MKQPVFSERISAGTRVYYIDGRVDTKGGRYITLTEIPTEKHPGQPKRQRIFIHPENVDSILQAFAEAAEQIKKP